MSKEDYHSSFFIEPRRLRDGDRYILRERRFDRSGLLLSVHDLMVYITALSAERDLAEAENIFH